MVRGSIWPLRWLLLLLRLGLWSVWGLLGLLLGAAGMAALFLAADCPSYVPVLGALFLLGGIAATWRLLGDLRGAVRWFSYDGTVLRFRTLVSREEQARIVSDIRSISALRSNVGVVGQEITFEDGQKAMLYYGCLAKARELVERLEVARRHEKGTL
jgi:hypothetical protein